MKRRPGTLSPRSDATLSTQSRKTDPSACWFHRRAASSRTEASPRRWKTSRSRVSKPAQVRQISRHTREFAQFRGATYFAIYGRGIDRIDGGRGGLTWPNTAC